MHYVRQHLFYICSYLQSNRTINDIIEKQTKKQMENKPKLGTHTKEFTERFPAILDPRCFTHKMRPVPYEHWEVLYTS